MSEEEALWDPVDSPLEFALLALDLLLDQELNPDDALDLQSQDLAEGFSLVHRFRDAIELSISHDAASSVFVGSAAFLTPVCDVQTLQLALQFNGAMPAERRFAMDTVTQGLVLTQTWPAPGLELADLALGLRVLVQGLDMVCRLSPQEAVSPAAESAHFLRV
jgi:hypothetical protein